jgi:hypothetical protein
VILLLRQALVLRRQRLLVVLACGAREGQRAAALPEPRDALAQLE